MLRLPTTHFKKFLLPLIASSLLIACTTTNDVSGRKQVMAFGPEDDIAMGTQAMEEIKKTEDVVTSGPYAERVSRLGLAIAAKSDRPDFPWEFIAIRSDQLNAFALPGGQSAVYTEMMDTFNKDPQLAAVMGHEIAHAVLRHGAEQVSRAQYQSGIIAVVGVLVGTSTDDGDKAQGAMELAAMATQLGAALPHSRKMELEADHFGTIYMARAGFDPRNAPALWRKMAELTQGMEKPPLWFSTHPSDEQRIAQLEANMDMYMKIYNNNK